MTKLRDSHDCWQQLQFISIYQKNSIYKIIMFFLIIRWITDQWTHVKVLKQKHKSSNQRVENNTLLIAIYIIDIYIHLAASHHPSQSIYKDFRSCREVFAPQYIPGSEAYPFRIINGFPATRGSNESSFNVWCL